MENSDKLKLVEHASDNYLILTDHDQVWLNQERKLNGICQDIIQTRHANRDVLVLAHFDQSLHVLAAALRRQDIGFGPYRGFTSSDARAEFVWLGLANGFQPQGIKPAGGPERPLSILVAEHHPLASRDDAIRNVATTLNREGNLCFYVALTDPLITYFSDERIQQLFRQLGADEETPLSHPLIDTAIRSAQEKIEKKVRTEIPTLSAEDWFKFNLRENLAR